MNDDTAIDNMKRELEQMRMSVKDRETREVRRKKRRWHLTAWETAIVVVVIAVGLAAGAYAAVTLFSHNIPAVAQGTVAIATACPGAVTGNGTVIAGSGWVYFGCTASTGAVQVKTASAIVTVSNPQPAPYNAVYLVPSAGVELSGQSSCATFTGSAILPSSTTGASFTTPTVGTYFYCLDYAGMSSAGLPAFTISWSQ